MNTPTTPGDNRQYAAAPEWLQRLRGGEGIDFGPQPVGPETAYTRAARTLAAAALVDFFKDDEQRAHGDVRIFNAVIDGDLGLAYFCFDGEVEIGACEFTGALDLTFAEFKRSAQLVSCRFHKAANFRGMRAERDFAISGSVFGGDASFADAHMAGGLEASSTAFQRVDFTRAVIGKYAHFKAVPGEPPTVFAGKSDFRFLDLSGTANFDGAEFTAPVSFRRAAIGEALFRGVRFDAIASFESFSVSGGAHFDKREYDGKPVVFGGKAVFTGMQVKSGSFRSAHFDNEVSFLRSRFEEEADFAGARFDKYVDFSYMSVSGPAWFVMDQAPVSFVGNARFFRAVFSATASFEGALFNAHAEFNAIRVGVAAYFGSAPNGVRTRFVNGAEFVEACFDEEATIKDAEFLGSTTFLHARFGSTIEFSGARFDGQAIWEGAQFDGPAFFGSTDSGPAMFAKGAKFSFSTFRSWAVFRDASFQGPPISRVPPLIRPSISVG